ncbi:MAG: tagatose 1,6-diphosphate aldolase [Anaerolineae bacterium]|nr:tagatose 1,6-diphosphate aldolase [Anaerolineae bacterium]
MTESTVPTLTANKRAGIDACADSHGVIAALAIDQRGSLQRAIAIAKGAPATPDELSEFKALVTEVLSPYSSAVLLDAEYGLEAIKRLAPNVGLLLAYEQSGYDTLTRMPDLMPTWSVRQLIEAGAQAVKVVMQYDPDDDDDKIARQKLAFVERVGSECAANDVPFFFEPVTYDRRIRDEKSIEYAKIKPEKVQRTMLEFSKPQYRVDVLKVEIPINIRYVEGARANTDNVIAYSRSAALEAFHKCAAATNLPFIYLSAGVTNDIFVEALELAAESKSAYAGVLCGRATWQDGVTPFVKNGNAGLRKWLETEGVRNIQAVNAAVAKGASSWRRLD